MSKAAELAKIGEVATNSQIGGRRNLVINGAMQVAQRGTVTAVANNEYTLDRFAFTHSQDGAFTVTQDSSAPDGFGNSLKLDVTTVDDSLSASQYLIMEHKIEAQNLQQLQFGKSGAKNITLSFYVKSNKTGTYGVNIIQSDNSSKIANLTYTINSADTWEQKSLTFTGDTSGAINDDNGIGLKLGFTLAVGSTWTSGNTSASFRAFANGNYGGGHAVNILDNTSNEWYITGIQMEVGSQATPFENRSFGDELALCQRYYYHTYSYGSPAGTTFNQDYESPIIIIGTGNHGMGVCNAVYPVEMRVAPTVSFYGSDGTANRIRYWGGSLAAYGTVNRSTRQILGMSFDTGTNPEDFYSAALVCDAEL